MNVRELQNVIALNMLTIVVILFFKVFRENGMFPLERLLNYRRVSSVVGSLPYGFRTSLAGIAFSLFFMLWLHCQYSFIRVCFVSEQ